VLGLVLVWFGGLFVFASVLALGLSFSKESNSLLEACDWVFLGGTVTFFRSLLRGISEGFRDRKSSARPLVILLVIGSLLLVAGLLL
jgi:hypothetical protein